MIKVLFVLLLTVPLFSTTLVKHTLYEKTDRIDLMLTFDKPYNGKITKTENLGSVILLLNKMDFKNKEFSKHFDSPIVQDLTIVPYEDKTLIEVKGKNKFNLNASKTVDNMGLRIRITQELPVLEKTKPTPIQTQLPLAPKEQTIAPVQSNFDFTTQFIKIIFVLGIIIALLWLIKRWIENKNSTSNWLFNKEIGKNDIKILQQKPIDMKNKITLVSFQHKKYLLLLGESNLLLDHFEENEDEDDQFNKLLAKNSKRLGDYLEED